jgi:thiamine-phosphate pyrophosphorylase
MKLLLISPQTDLPHETTTANRLLDMSVHRYHLRKPHYTTTQYEQYIQQILPQHRRRLVIHGSYELYDKQKLGGIHLNSAARTDKEVWENLKGIPSSAISTSFHSWQEIENNSFPYRYVFISPLFDSISKACYKAAVAIPDISQTRKKAVNNNTFCPQIIGLGGINPHSISQLLQHGYDGAALLGTIWLSPDPIAAFVDMVIAINQGHEPPLANL